MNAFVWSYFSVVVWTHLASELRTECWGQCWSQIAELWRKVVEVWLWPSGWSVTKLAAAFLLSMRWMPLQHVMGGVTKRLVRKKRGARQEKWAGTMANRLYFTKLSTSFSPDASSDVGDRRQFWGSTTATEKAARSHPSELELSTGHNNSFQKSITGHHNLGWRYSLCNIAISLF